MEADVSFGAWVAMRRRALDLTRQQLTDCIGCSVSGLRKVETDERRPSRQIAELLAQCLQIPPEKHPAFVKVARGVERVERLGEPLSGLVGTWARPVPHSVASNLPVLALPLIGREPELATLKELLCDPQCRLLTLVGPGGIGKTRLAVEAASTQQERHADGVHFVPLAALTSPQFIVPAIANALGLLNHLRDRSLLLLLDNFEHLLEASGFLAELLQQAPGVKLLVTSRERLNLQGEWLFDLQGLPVPPPEQVDWAEEYSAVELFVHSARRAQASFVLKAEDRLAVSRICQLVEGMPLAIELAAAWVRILTCEEIASEIRRSLDFLATDAHDVPERHHSLRGVFDHSWNLLSASERSTLCRLTVFEGGFTREAAEQIAGASLRSLSALASKSLLHRSKNGRYDLHEVVRQYALSRLADDPQSEAIREQHASFYLALLRDREQGLRGAGQRETLRELTEEIGNVHAAWDWAVKRSSFVQLGQALRCFAWLYEMRGWYGEGIRQIELVVEALQAQSKDEEQQAVLGHALAQQGLLLFRRGQFKQALALLEQSLAVLRPIGNRALLLDPLVFSGVVLFLFGEASRSQVLLEECLAHARAVDDLWFAAYALFNLGYIASLRGLYAEAYDQMGAGLALWRRLGDSRSTALGLNYISPTAIKLGRHHEARSFLQESLLLCTEVGDRWGMGTAYRHLGLLALAQGDLVQAQAHLRKSMELFGGFITGWDVVQSLVYLGEATAAAGKPAEARRIFLDALDQAVEVWATPLALDALIGLAYLQSQSGDLEQAWEIVTCVLSHLASTQETRDRAEHLRVELEDQLVDQIGAARTQPRTFGAIVEAILSSSRWLKVGEPKSSARPNSRMPEEFGGLQRCLS
jgi:predicted ATPase/transcriptional regulator with XRE-family HTH domain